VKRKVGGCCESSVSSLSGALRSLRLARGTVRNPCCYKLLA